jgi:uncharacterized membrane protein YfcA
MLQTILNPLNVSWGVWFITLGCAFINGLSKSGLKGIAMVTVPVLAYYYGGMTSTGIVLPFLIIGDIFALRYYHRSAQWQQVKKLLPWAIAGIFLAVLVGKMVNDSIFRNIIAIIVFLCLALMFIFDLTGKKADLSKSKPLSIFTGLSGGFATMIGNAAGPIFDLYLLSMRLPKINFIGTGAIFYLTLNFIKLPLHIFVWKSVTLSSLQMNFVMIPAVYLGTMVGRKIVSLIPEKAFRYFVLIVIAISAFLLLIK